MNYVTGDGVCNNDLLTESCCFDKGDCDHKSNSSVVCPSCGQKSSDDLIGDCLCDSFLLQAACCYDGGDCGCPTCPQPEKRLGDGRCDRELDTSECCNDGGDCFCLEMTLAFNQCCPESGSAWCFPPNSLCPTCSLDLSPYLTNQRCDTDIYANQDCCFDSLDCGEQISGRYFINNTVYDVDTIISDEMLLAIQEYLERNE